MNESKGNIHKISVIHYNSKHLLKREMSIKKSIYEVWNTPLFLICLLYWNAPKPLNISPIWCPIKGMPSWNSYLLMATSIRVTIQRYLGQTSTTWSILTCLSSKISWWVDFRFFSSPNIIYGWKKYIMSLDETSYHPPWTRNKHTLYILW